MPKHLLVTVLLSTASNHKHNLGILVAVLRQCQRTIEYIFTIAECHFLRGIRERSNGSLRTVDLRFPRHKGHREGQPVLHKRSLYRVPLHSSLESSPYHWNLHTNPAAVQRFLISLYPLRSLRGRIKCTPVSTEIENQRQFHPLNLNLTAPSPFLGISHKRHANKNQYSKQSSDLLHVSFINKILCKDTQYYQDNKTNVGFYI